MLRSTKRTFLLLFLVNRLCGTPPYDDSFVGHSPPGCYRHRTDNQALTCRCEEDYCNAQYWVCHECENCEVTPGVPEPCRADRVKKCFTKIYPSGRGETFIKHWISLAKKLRNNVTFLELQCWFPIAKQTYSKTKESQENFRHKIIDRLFQFERKTFLDHV